MTNESLSIKLSRLDYSKTWINLGILSTDELEKQLIEFETGEDPNKEHYRYKTFSKFLSSVSTISNTFLKNIFEILETEKDKTMAGSAIILLLKQGFLKDDQFDMVVEFSQVFGDLLTKPIDTIKRGRSKRS